MPTFDYGAISRLAERTEYEAWFLEAVYAISEQELFPSWPDSVVYPIDRSTAQFFSHARANIVLGDWRPAFLNAGAPLVFTSTFKLVDMVVEWVLEENGVPTTFRFQEKLKQLARSPMFPPPVESRPWLKERVIGLYRTLEPLRGTIIHDRHFTTVDGAIRVSSSRNGAVGPVFELSPAHLRTLALTTVSILRYIGGTWNLDEIQDKTLRYNLDTLADLHGQQLLGQRRPFHTRVRVFTAGDDPLHVDPEEIGADMATRYVDQDSSFDVLLLMVKNREVVDAYLYPWALLAIGGSGWSAGINAEQYRTAIPSDIKPEHLR